MVDPHSIKSRPGRPRSTRRPLESAEQPLPPPQPRPRSGTRPRRVLAVASGGGHWVQLLRLRPALADMQVAYVTVRRSYAADVPGERLHVVPDATRWNKLKLLWMAMRILWILARERPDVVLSTGAAPGFFAIRMGKWLGARGIWVDSIANVEQLSLSGRRIGRHADLWLTQWPHLARADGPSYRGAVL